MTDKLDSFGKAQQQSDSFSRATDPLEQSRVEESQELPQQVQEKQPEVTEEETPPVPLEENLQEDETNTSKNEKPQEEGEESGNTIGDYMKDGYLMAFRGAEAAAEGIWDLADTVTGDDLLPDWDRKENNVFGTAKTGVGKFGVGLVQFATGLIPGLGAVSLLGKVGKATRLTSALSKGKGILKSYSKNQLSLSPDTMKKLSKLKAGTKSQVKFATMGAISEFTAFQGKEERLSNMLATHETGTGPVQDVINWLAYDPNNENSNELVERGKLAIEGLIVGETLALAGLAVSKGYRAIKPKRTLSEVDSEDAIDEKGDFVPFRGRQFKREIPEMEGAANAAKKAVQVHADTNAALKTQIANGEEPDKWAAMQSAKEKQENIPTQAEINDANALAKRNDDKKRADDFKEKTGIDPRTAKRPERIEEAQKEMSKTKVPKVSDIDPETADEKALDAFLLERDITGVTNSVEVKRQMVKDIIEQSKDGGTEHLIESIKNHVIKVVEEAGLFDKSGGQSLISGVRVLNSMTEMRSFLGHMAKVAMKARKKGKGTPEAANKFYEETVRIANAGLEGAGGKEGIDLTPFRDRVEDLELVRAEAEVLYDAMNDMAKDLQGKVANARTAIQQKTVIANVNGKEMTLNQDEAMTEVFSAMDRWAALQEIWADFGTQLSLGLRQRQDLYTTGQSSLGRDIAGQHRTLGVAVDKASKKRAELFRRQSRGVVSDKRIIKDLEKVFKKSGQADLEESMEKMVKDFNQVGVNKTVSTWMLGARKGLAVSQEWYYNAILGSPTSWAVNFLGGALVLPLRHIESIGGGVMTGNVDLVKANFRTMFDLHSWGESLRYLWKSGMDEEARSIAGYTAYRDDRLLSPKGEISVDNPEGTLFRSAYNWLGKAVRMPSRIMMAGDEFFKQMNYRSRIRTSLALSGYKKGLHRQPGALAKHIEEGFNTTITAKGRFRNEQNVRREAVESLLEARKAGEKIANERKYINDYMDDHYSNNKLKRVKGIVYDESLGFEAREQLVESGTDWALVNTFTNDVENGFFKKTGEIAQMSPWLGFIIPFVRTPSNILLFAMGRAIPNPVNVRKQYKKSVDEIQKVEDTPLETLEEAIGEIPEAKKMAQNYIDVIQNDESIKAAEAIGRLSTGILTMGTLYMNIETLGDRITGSPPEDPGKREAWEATGKRAFSIKLGDKWHSYQRLDPFATIIGMMADISQGFSDIRDTGVSEFGNEEEFEEKQAYLMQVSAIIATSIANNTTKKTYFENLGYIIDAMNKPAEAFPKIAGNILGGFVPNGLNWSQNVFEEEPALLEAKGILEKMRRRLPAYMRPGEKIMPRRNAFGEIMRKSQADTGSLGKGLNPFYSSEISNDIVDIEIEHQAVGRKRMEPVRRVGGAVINYRDYRNEKGQTAYDRLQELSGSMKLGPAGLTLRQALREKIQSNAYQNLPPVTEENRHKDHPRSKALTKTINRYRSYARRQTLKEFKELRADLANLLR